MKSVLNIYIILIELSFFEHWLIILFCKNSLLPPPFFFFTNYKTFPVTNVKNKSSLANRHQVSEFPVITGMKGRIIALNDAFSNESENSFPNKFG